MVGTKKTPGCYTGGKLEANPGTSEDIYPGRACRTKGQDPGTLWRRCRVLDLGSWTYLERRWPSVNKSTPQMSHRLCGSASRTTTCQILQLGQKNNILGPW